GLRTELVTAMIKALPKAIRRNVVPAADWAARLMQDLPADAVEELSLAEYLAAQIQRQTYTPVAIDDFDLDSIPPHLQVTFAVVNEHGTPVARSKDLQSLQSKLKSRTRESIAKVVVKTPNALERDGLTSWDFDTLPKLIDTRQGGNTVRAYPALVDRGASVSIQLMGTPEDQARAMRGGVRRMLLLAIPSPTSYVQNHLTSAEKLSLGASPYPSTAALFEDCMAACIDSALADTGVWTRADFERVRDGLSATIMDDLFSTVGLVARVLAAAREAQKAISAASTMALLAPLADAREQLETLIRPGFVSGAGLSQLRRLPVYLAGITHRVGKLADNLGRDRTWMAEVQGITERFQKAGGTMPLKVDADPQLVRARWLIEELRLSLFAQHLGTAEPVSVQRIQKALVSAG